MSISPPDHLELRDLARRGWDIAARLEQESRPRAWKAHGGVVRFMLRDLQTVRHEPDRLRC